MLSRFFSWARGEKERQAATEAVESKASGGRHISSALLSAARTQAQPKETLGSVLEPAARPSWARSVEMAADAALAHDADEAEQVPACHGGLSFMGYSRLAVLAQTAEYRRPALILAGDCTRQWIKFTGAGEDVNGARSAKIKLIEVEFRRIRAREACRAALEAEGLFGRSHIYIDTGDVDNVELASVLSHTAAKVKRGSLRGLKVVEPYWVWPGAYSSTDPLSPHFYAPQTWHIQGKHVHKSRLLTFVSRPVPDQLKPAFAFGGISLTQLGRASVENFLNVRADVAGLLRSFTIWVLKTDMSGAMNGDDDLSPIRRAEMFNALRDTRGLMLIDRESEDFGAVSAPVQGMQALVAQAQEHQSAVFGIPLVKLFGISPSGLNASSEGEIRVYYDTISSIQEQVLRPALQDILAVVQLSLFGEIDAGIGFVFCPLMAMTPKELAEIDAMKANTAQVRTAAGVIDTSEERDRLMAEEDSPYSGLEPKEVVGKLEEPRGESLA